MHARKHLERSARRGAVAATLWIALCPAGASARAAGEDDVVPHAPMPAQWTSFGVAEGLPSERVLAVVVDGETVWAGTEGGLARLAGDAVVEVLGVEQGLPFPAISSLALDPESGDLWVGTLGGLARVSAGRVDAFSQLDSGLANDVIYGVALQDGAVWIATASGLSRYLPATNAWEIFDQTNTLMHEPWCYAVAGAGGDVYVAVWGGGVVVREGATGVFREHRDPDKEMEIDLYRDDGLVHDVTSAVAYANEVLWVGTYFGLSRYDGRRWRSYSKQDSGLAGDFINTVRANGDAAWIGTDQGLSRFDSRRWHTWHRRAEGRGWELTVTEEDGSAATLPLVGGPASDTIYDVAFEGDVVWLATAEGLSRGAPEGAPTLPSETTRSTESKGQ